MPGSPSGRYFGSRRTGGRPLKLKKQVDVKLEIGRIEKSAVFLIIPKLTKECVIGVDIFKPLREIMDLGRGTLTYKMRKEYAL